MCPNEFHLIKSTERCISDLKFNLRQKNLEINNRRNRVHLLYSGVLEIIKRKNENMITLQISLFLFVQTQF